MSYFEKLHPEMDEYLENHGSKEPEHLVRLRKETYQKTLQPHMLSGYQQGRLLSILSKLISPKNILEIGTFTGYATLCLAEGLAVNGKILTLDINEELEYLPRKYFAESKYAEQIDFKIENALDFLKNNNLEFDLVFIDADKENYVEYFILLKPKIKSGAVLLFDNVLWYGKVLEENPDLESTLRIQELNEIVANDADFENVILPLRDGISILRRR